MRHNETIGTYDQAAPEFAAYFAGICARTELIEKGLELAGNPTEAKVVEVGCGDGRDAVEIVSRVGWYEGFDPSEGLLAIAHDRLPDARLSKSMLGYKYPEGIYAFAPFLHLNRNDFKEVCQKVATALRLGGVLLMTLKERQSYQEELVDDHFGKRMFYYYDELTVRQLTEDSFEFVFLEREQIKDTSWLYVGLRRV